MKIAAIAALLVLCLAVQQAEATTIRLHWTKGRLSASMPRSGGRYLNAAAKEMKVCSGDVVNFSWSGETMGMFGFYTESAYNSCSKSDLNFIKNIHTSGSFDTKSNESGWRYYAYITDAGHGTCAQKIKIFWDKNC